MGEEKSTISAKQSKGRVIFIAVGLLTLLLLFSFIAYKRLRLDTFISCVGLIVSLYGLVVTIWQLLLIRSSAELTEKAIINTSERIETILSVSDVSKAVALSRQVIENLSDKKYELARFRLCEVKDVLVKVLCVPSIVCDEKEIKRTVQHIEVHISSLDKQVNNISEINLVTIGQDIEKMVKLLVSIETNLRINTNG